MASNIKIKVNDVYEGLNGMSAYELAVKHGFVGTEQDWLESLKDGGASVIVKSFMLPASSWVVSEIYPGIKFRADILEEEITTSDLVMVDFDILSLILANNAYVLNGRDTLNGAVRLYSKRLPDETLTGRIIIVKGGVG